MAAQIGIGLVAAIAIVVAANGALAARARMTSGAASSASRPREESFHVAQSSAATPAAAQPPAPVVAAGRTALQGGIIVERGDSVVVHFDTPVYRTRRRDKFEHVVRTTLPAVYGALADSALAALPMGELAAAGNLLTEIPASGVQLPPAQGWAITLWPGTRPGQDGPLVVRYRVSVAPAK